MKHNFLKIFVLISVVMFASCSFSYEDSSSNGSTTTSVNYYNFVSIVLTDNQLNQYNNQCIAKGIDVNKNTYDFTYQEAKDAIEIINDCGKIYNIDTGKREEVTEFFEQLERLPNGKPKEFFLERLDLKGNILVFVYLKPEAQPYTTQWFYIQKV